MSLNNEWITRTRRWREALKACVYIPLQDLDMRMHVTKSRLNVRQAAAASYRPVAGGEKWGAQWEYVWFRTRVKLPPQARGQRIELCLDVGREGRVLVNGREAGGLDREHHYICLTRQARAGQQFDVLIEAYAGHVQAGFAGGPVLHHAPDTLFRPPFARPVMGKNSFGAWNEEAYQLWCDMETLNGLRNVLDPDSLRVSEIDAALREFTYLLDPEAPYDEMMKGLRAVRRRVKPLLDCVNGSTAPVLHAFGHSHIDVAWLWPLAETERKCARTFSTQLALMEEYPEFKLLQSQPHLYWMTKQWYPELYARIKQAVRRGQFIPEGGMWVESDTNIPCGESLVRQFLHGKRFFREEFGVESELLWLPDVFGYSGSLPQIMRGCGIKYFSTAKIFWLYYGGDPFPYNTFVWEGIDGTEILAHFCNDYSSQTTPEALTQRWKGRVQKDGIRARLLPFGHGDGGGGPTRDHLEYLRRSQDLEGLPRVRQESPMEFFKELEKEGMPPARYVGELYYQCHRGTYTSQARTKQLNRRSELALRELELWSVAAHALNGHALPMGKLDGMWKKVLLNQFHDIIPGSSIKRVHVEANAAYEEVLREAGQLSGDAISALAGKGSNTVVFNSLPWERRVQIQLPENNRAVNDADGSPIALQRQGKKLFAEVTVPACGWTTLRPAEKPVTVENILKVTEKLLENEYLRVTFNARGEITSLLDKETGRQYAAGLCNSMKMYKDVPSTCDAWDIDSMYKSTPVDLSATAQIKVLARGPLFVALGVRRLLANSTLKQEIILRRGSRCLEFKTVIDWREQHRLLKVAFPVTIHNSEALHEIQFGHIQRPTHASRPFDADRYEVACQKWSALCEERGGVAVLNDSKYGVDVSGNSINLTLLRAPMSPAPGADRGRHEFTYAFYAWTDCLMGSGLTREAYQLNVPVLTTNGDAGTNSLFSASADNIVIETIKPAEDGSADFVVRLYEAMRAATDCELTSSLPFDQVLETNMLENKNGARRVDKNGKIKLKFRAFEIKTLRFVRNPRKTGKK